MDLYDLEHLVAEEMRGLDLSPDFGPRDLSLREDPLLAYIAGPFEQEELGPPLDASQQPLPFPLRGGHVGSPGPEAIREIEGAIDEFRWRPLLDPPMCPQYMAELDDAPDHIVLILGWPMPEPPFGP